MVTNRRPTSFKPFVAALLLLLLVPFLVLSGSVADAVPKIQPPSPATRLVLHVYFRSTAERDSLAYELDATEATTAAGYLTVVGDQAEVAALRQRGLRVEVDAQQTENLNTRVKFGTGTDSFYGGYHTVEEMQAFLDQEAAAYPNLAEKVNIGPSWCKAHPGQCTQPNSWNGFDLQVMHITNRNISGPKPVFWANSGIHAREIAPPEIALDFIDYLLSNYDTNADAHWMVDYQDIWVMVPMNPDGHHLVELGVDWRKNADNVNGCTTFPLFGTDANRNFPFLWNCCGGSSSDPCNEAYHGPSAASEEETQAVVDKISQLIPDQRGPNITDAAPITTTGTYIDLHSFSPANLYPWAMYGFASPNNADLKNIAFHFSSTNADPPGNDYTPCQFGSCLYIADGASNDWVYGELGAAGFATEIGDTFTPTYTDTQTILWPQNRGMLLYLSKIARMPYLMTRGPDTTLVASNPMTITQGIPSQLNATINYAWDYHGAYSNYIQSVAAAEYYLDTPPWAGGTPVAMQPVDGQFDSPVEAVQANVQTGSIPVGRHILFVRGRGGTSYEGLESWGPVSATWLVVLPYASPTPTVTGTPPTATPTRTLTPTVTPSTTPCSAPVLQNGGFETGSLSPWVVLESVPTPTVTTRQHHSGSYSLFLGDVPGFESLGNTSVYQQITVPSTGGTLSFWYYTFTRDRINFDWQDAYITDLSGNILATIMHVCDGSEIWTNRTFDLFPYKNQTIRVEFLVHQDGAGDVTNMYVDDVRVIEACAATPVPPSPTNTATGTATSTALPPSPTANATDTSVPPTTVATTTAILPTDTPAPPTATSCPIQFSDVPPGSTFYDYVRCLACRGIISGYPDGTFRPGNPVTRGQLSKIVSNSAGYSENFTTNTFEDVAPGSTFFPYVERLYAQGGIQGYACGGAGEPCVPPANKPYFRPNANVTRGQTSKIVAVAKGLPPPLPGQQTFEDVPPGSTFWTWVEALAASGAIQGYACGGVGEPCVPPGNRPYFRPNSSVTRGQSSKIVANSFFPGCVTPNRK